VLLRKDKYSFRKILMADKNIFDLSPGLEEKLRRLLGKYEESLKRIELRERLANTDQHNDQINGSETPKM